MSVYRFVEPSDILFLRGNKLFGDSGSYGESLIPPWPSVASGAIRTFMLAREGIELSSFSSGEIHHPQLGTPDLPGSFTLSDFQLARRTKRGIEALYPLPADLVGVQRNNGYELRRLMPGVVIGVSGSYPLQKWPLLQHDRRSKRVSGLWMTQSGWQKYLGGSLPHTGEILRSEQLWKTDPRVGVGLDTVQRSSQKGMLFTSQAIAMEAGHGFLIAVDGADLPLVGMLRLGGDGRSAMMQPTDYEPPHIDFSELVEERRCRIVLTAPGLFPDGWKLPTQENNGTIRIGNLTARVTCAAVPRAEVISGWDLSANNGKGQPKVAERVVPSGSVYWLEELETTPDELSKLMERGFWMDSDYNTPRRAEGFNRFTFATY